MLILRKAGKHWLNLHILRKHKILDHLPSVMSMHFWCFYFFEFLNFWVNWTTERSTVFLKNSKKFLVQVAPEPSTVEMLRDSVLNISGGILDFALIFNKWMHNLHQHQIGRNRLDLWSKTTWKLQQWDNLESAPLDR